MTRTVFACNTACFDPPYIFSLFNGKNVILTQSPVCRAFLRVILRDVSLRDVKRRARPSPVRAISDARSGRSSTCFSDPHFSILAEVNLDHMADQKMISHYRIIGEAGRGGMATVFLAQDTRLDRQVVIKVLPKYFVHDPQFRRRFFQEAQVVAKLSHPNIVPVYEYGEEDEVPYLVMGYMSGGTLADRIEDGPIPLVDAIKIITPDSKRLFISGTASIDKDGNTIFLDDTPKQLEMTMQVVEAIVADAGMKWGDTVSAMAYFKYRKDFSLFDDYCKAHGINIPHVKIHADVCRDDLLFELELDAIVKS